MVNANAFFRQKKVIKMTSSYHIAHQVWSELNRQKLKSQQNSTYQFILAPVNVELRVKSIVYADIGVRFACLACATDLPLDTLEWIGKVTSASNTNSHSERKMNQNQFVTLIESVFPPHLFLLKLNSSLKLHVSFAFV